ncbi:MAG: c-type cytochrome [Gemmatimonadota bacterium]
MPNRRTAMVLAFLVLLVLPLRAQIPEKFENLKVLPADITRPQLLQVMRGFALGLGVRCQFCHVGQEGAPFSTFDFKSDEKPTKRTARVMLRMVHAINETWLSQLDTISHDHMAMGDAHSHADRIEVQCVTCHRGNSRPQTMESVMTGLVADSGIPAAVNGYRELKRRYYGSFAFDFRERPLNSVAFDLLRQNRAEDALTIANLNLEVNPEAASVYQLQGDANLALGRRDAAVVSYRRALELQPDNQPLRARVDSLSH